MLQIRPKSPGIDDRFIRTEIEKYEALLKKQPKSVNHMCKISDLYFDAGKRHKAQPYLERAVDVYLDNYKTPNSHPLPGEELIIDSCLKFWKGDRYMSKKQEKGDLRLNYSKERSAALKRIESVLETMLGKDEGGENTKKKDHSLLLKMAYVRESMGLVLFYPTSHPLSYVFTSSVQMLGPSDDSVNSTGCEATLDCLVLDS